MLRFHASGQCQSVVGGDDASAGRLLRQCRNYVIGFGDEAEAFLHVPQGRLVAEIRGRGATAILDQYAIVSQEMRVGQRMQHALIGVDAAEEQRLDVEVLEDAVQWRIPKAADAILVDLDVAGVRLELVLRSNGQASGPN